MWVRKTPNKWQNAVEILIILSLMITWALLVKSITIELHPLK